MRFLTLDSRDDTTSATTGFHAAVAAVSATSSVLGDDAPRGHGAVLSTSRFDDRFVTVPGMVTPSGALVEPAGAPFVPRTVGAPGRPGVIVRRSGTGRGRS